ncbi:hypothetical protein CIHG_02042 [Coccidioides immitis H538.4]|uniref:RING-type domain-containing protein n=1 Tax=Coccidioides immitis H538.4 TaxID=396776 RepID=A0A0J8RI17_COCIT|nr:hypothetical protein CIHG_02042 [Coccidioides immitis H538.4]
MLTTWATIESASSLPHYIHLQVIIITGTTPYNSMTWQMLDETDLLLDLLHPENDCLFSSFTHTKILCLQEVSLANTHYVDLECNIVEELHMICQDQKANQLSFSAVHLNVFFHDALQHMTKDCLGSFNFLQSSRRANAANRSSVSHLQVFFTKGAAQLHVCYNKLASYVSSTILMDAYPPHMHKFCPHTVFHTLYWNTVYSALQQASFSHTSAKLLSQCIENDLAELFELMKHPLPCGHSMCNTCVQIHGEGITGIYSEFVTQKCIICQDPVSLKIWIKPHTAEPCVLSIERGSSCVIIPIQILCLMQKHLGPNLLLFIMVDFNIGTSSGGYIVLNINTDEYNIEETKDFFSLTSDGKYDGGALNNILAGHFGPTVQMFETPQSIVSGGKIAITAATINNGSLFLFTNYNAETPLEKNHSALKEEKKGTFYLESIGLWLDSLV